MRLIEKSGVYEYYKGIDIEKLRNHPKDGSSIIVCFFDTIEKENRNLKLDQLLEDKKYKNFVEEVESFDNNCILLYETRGHTEIIYKSIKDRLENVTDTYFAVSGKKN